MKNLIFAAMMAASLMAQADDLGAPALASEQKRVASEAFKHESEQFRQRAIYNSAQNRHSTLQKRRDLQGKAFARAQDLVAKGQMTEEQLHKAHQNFMDAEDAISKNIADIAKSKASALVAKYRVLEMGNPDQDHRRDIAMAMLEGANGEREGYRKSLANVHKTRDYFQKRYEAGKYLHERNAISLQDLECRELEFNAADDSVRTLEFQIGGLGDAVTGLEQSLSKLPK